MASRFQLPTQWQELHLRSNRVHSCRIVRIPELLHAHYDCAQPWQVRLILHPDDFCLADRFCLSKRPSHLRQESLCGQKPLRISGASDFNCFVPVLLSDREKLPVVAPFHSDRAQLHPVFLLQGWDIHVTGQMVLLFGVRCDQGPIQVKEEKENKNTNTNTQTQYIQERRDKYRFFSTNMFNQNLFWYNK